MSNKIQSHVIRHSYLSIIAAIHFTCNTSKYLK